MSLVKFVPKSWHYQSSDLSPDYLTILIYGIDPDQPDQIISLEQEYPAVINRYYFNSESDLLKYTTDYLDSRDVLKINYPNQWVDTISNLSKSQNSEIAESKIIFKRSVIPAAIHFSEKYDFDPYGYLYHIFGLKRLSKSKTKISYQVNSETIFIPEQEQLIDWIYVSFNDLSWTSAANPEQVNYVNKIQEFDSILTQEMIITGPDSMGVLDQSEYQLHELFQIESNQTPQYFIEQLLFWKLPSTEGNLQNYSLVELWNSLLRRFGIDHYQTVDYQIDSHQNWVDGGHFISNGNANHQDHQNNYLIKADEIFLDAVRPGMIRKGQEYQDFFEYLMLYQGTNLPISGYQIYNYFQAIGIKVKPISNSQIAWYDFKRAVYLGPPAIEENIIKKLEYTYFGPDYGMLVDQNSQIEYLNYCPFESEGIKQMVEFGLKQFIETGYIKLEELDLSLRLEDYQIYRKCQRSDEMQRSLAQVSLEDYFKKCPAKYIKTTQGDLIQELYNFDYEQYQSIIDYDWYIDRAEEWLLKLTQIKSKPEN